MTKAQQLKAWVASARKALASAATGTGAWLVLVQASSEPGVTAAEWKLLPVFLLVPGAAAYFTPNRPPA